MKFILKDNFEQTPVFDYYKYMGSLTTPPCEEYVIYFLNNENQTVWFILAKPIPLGTTSIEMIRTANDVPQSEKLKKDFKTSEQKNWDGTYRDIQ